MNPSITILIINYNGAAYVMKSIESALAQRYDGPLRILVVDNGSTDDSVALLREIRGIDVLEHSANGGYGAGVNFALPAIDSDYVAFLNPDAQAKPEWLAMIVPFMLAGDIAFASSIISAGSTTYFASGIYYPSLGISIDSHEYRDDTDWLTGCALVASRVALSKLNGFDDEFFLYYEDVDLSLRAREQGYRLKVLQETLVDHPDHGSSTSGLGRRKMEIIYHSRGRLIAKHVTPWLRFPALAAALVLAVFRNRISIAWMPPITREMLRGFRGVRATQ